MKRIAILTAIATIITGQLIGQDNKSQGLEKVLVKKFINQQFGNLVNPQSNNNIGNFASLDFKEAEVSFGGNIIFNNGSILGIKTKGSVSDGFLPVFSNDKLNTKLELDIQYNFLDFKKKLIIYDNSTYEEYQTLREKVEHDYEIKKIEIEKGQKKLQLQLEIKKITNQISTLEAKLETLIDLSKDSLDVEISKLKQELVFKNSQVNNLPTKEAMIFELDNWKATEILKAESEVKIYGFKIGWFSLGYGITNNAFRMFDGTLVPDKQIIKTNYANHSIKIQYNFYSRTPAVYESYFISVGTTFSIQDNFSDLTKVEINETKNYGTNPSDRFITNKYNAYQGAYFKDLKSLLVYTDFYWFLFDDNKGAIHFYPEQKMVENLKSSTNLGFGFLMTFKNKEKTDNIINVELYAKLLDISNNNNSTEKLFIRSGYGLRFTFPINFNSKL